MREICGAVTTTVPPAPVPAVALEISAPVVSKICDAFTASDPASPVVPAWVSVAIRVAGPLNDSGPAVLTTTFPAFPVLTGKPWSDRIALLEIEPPLRAVAPPTATATAPAAPDPFVFV